MKKENEIDLGKIVKRKDLRAGGGTGVLITKGLGVKILKTKGLVGFSFRGDGGWKRTSAAQLAAERNWQQREQKQIPFGNDK